MEEEHRNTAAALLRSNKLMRTTNKWQILLAHVMHPLRPSCVDWISLAMSEDCHRQQSAFPLILVRLRRLLLDRLRGLTAALSVIYARDSKKNYFRIKRIIPRMEDFKMATFKSPCGACGGTGWRKRDSGKGHTDKPCPKCGGTGVIVTEETPAK